jgi:hypothetical protein
MRFLFLFSSLSFIFFSSFSLLLAEAPTPRTQMILHTLDFLNEMAYDDTQSTLFLKRLKNLGDSLDQKSSDEELLYNQITLLAHSLTVINFLEHVEARKMLREKLIPQALVLAKDPFEKHSLLPYGQTAQLVVQHYASVVALIEAPPIKLEIKLAIVDFAYTLFLKDLDKQTYISLTDKLSSILNHPSCQTERLYERDSELCHNFLDKMFFDSFVNRPKNPIASLKQQEHIDTAKTNQDLWQHYVQVIEAKNKQPKKILGDKRSPRMVSPYILFGVHQNAESDIRPAVALGVNSTLAEDFVLQRTNKEQGLQEQMFPHFFFHANAQTMFAPDYSFLFSFWGNFQISPDRNLEEDDRQRLFQNPESTFCSLYPKAHIRPQAKVIEKRDASSALDIEWLTKLGPAFGMDCKNINEQFTVTLSPLLDIGFQSLQNDDLGFYLGLTPSLHLHYINRKEELRQHHLFFDLDMPLLNNKGSVALNARLEGQYALLEALALFAQIQANYPLHQETSPKTLSITALTGLSFSF